MKALFRAFCSGYFTFQQAYIAGYIGNRITQKQHFFVGFLKTAPERVELSFLFCFSFYQPFKLCDDAGHADLFLVYLLGKS